MKKSLLTLCALGLLFSCQKDEVFREAVLENTVEESSIEPQDLQSKDELNKIILTTLQEGRYFKWTELNTDDLWSAIQLSENKVNVFWGMDAITSKSSNSIESIILANESSASKSESPVFERSETLGYLSAEITNKQTLVDLLASDDVVYIEPMYEMYSEEELQRLSQNALQVSANNSYSGKVGQDAVFNQPASSGSINANIMSAWQKGYDAKGIKVAVIDNGVFNDHPLFGEGISSNSIKNPVTNEEYTRTVEKYGFFKTNPYAFWQGDDGNFSTGLLANPHGQAMMSAIGGAPNDIYYQNDQGYVWGTGVAYGADLVSIRSSRIVFIGTLGSRKGVQKSFEYLAGRNDVKIISMSQGLVFWDEGIARAIRLNSDKLIFCAGGTFPGLILFPVLGIANFADIDFDKSSVTLFPAKMPEVYSVTGVNDKNTWCFDCFGNADFVLEFNDNELPFFFKDGGSSSFATATTAGLAAIIWGTDPDASAKDVIDKMKLLSENPVNLHPNFGHGRIDMSKFDGLEAVENTLVSLKGSNNKYVSSENGERSINCNRGNIGPWEKFEMVSLNDDYVALKGSNGKYVSSENGQRSMTCNRVNIGPWEKFKVITLSDGRIALKGNNGRYVSSSNGILAMKCNRWVIGSWEKFSIE